MMQERVRVCAGVLDVFGRVQWTAPPLEQREFVADEHHVIPVPPFADAH